MDKSKIDKISSEFCLAICSTLPDFQFDKSSRLDKALRQIDSEPAKLLTFIAEVAQLVYSIKPLPKSEFPLKMTRLLSTAIIPKMPSLDVDNLALEERLVLFWMSLVRILIKFKSGYYQYDLSDKQLDNLEDTAKRIQRCALGYKVCSEKKVREFIDKLNV